MQGISLAIVDLQVNDGHGLITTRPDNTTVESGIATIRKAINTELSRRREDLDMSQEEVSKLLRNSTIRRYRGPRIRHICGIIRNIKAYCRSCLLKPWIAFTFFSISSSRALIRRKQSGLLQF